MASTATAGTIWFWTESAAAPAEIPIVVAERKLIRRITRKSSRSPS
jgi:hypothetical protein